MIRLQSENHAGEQTDQHDDRDGSGSYEINLLDSFKKLLASEGAKKRQTQKNGGRSHTVDPIHDRPADKSEGTQERRNLFSICRFGHVVPKSSHGLISFEVNIQNNDFS